MSLLCFFSISDVMPLEQAWQFGAAYRCPACLQASTLNPPTFYLFKHQCQFRSRSGGDKPSPRTATTYGELSGLIYFGWLCVFEHLELQTKYLRLILSPLLGSFLLLEAQKCRVSLLHVALSLRIDNFRHVVELKNWCYWVLCYLIAFYSVL